MQLTDRQNDIISANPSGFQLLQKNLRESQNGFDDLLSQKIELPSIDLDTATPEEKRDYQIRQNLMAIQSYRQYQKRRRDFINGTKALLDTPDDLATDEQIDAGLTAFARLTGVFDGKPLEEIAECFNQKNRRVLWSDKIKPALKSLFDSPKTSLDLMAMGEKERRAEFQKYWENKNLKTEKDFLHAQDIVAPAMGTAGGAGALYHFSKNEVPEAPKMPKPSEEDYEEWKREKTFGLQRLQMESLLAFTGDEEVAALAWKIAFSDNLSPEEKLSVIKNSNLTEDEARFVAGFAGMFNPELNAGWATGLYKGWNELKNLGENILGYSKETLPRLFSDLGLKEKSPIDFYESVQDEGGIDEYFKKNEISGGTRRGTFFNLYEEGRRQKELKQILKILEDADMPRYASGGFVLDGIADGVASAIRMLPILATNYIPYAGKFISMYLLVADMSYDLASQMEDLGFTEMEARKYGFFGGIVLGAIEHLQVSHIKKLDTELLDFVKSHEGKRLVGGVVLNTLKKGGKDLSKTTATEFTEETLQNFSTELTFQLGQYFEKKNLKGKEESIRDFIEATKNSIIPVFVSTGILGTTRGTYEAARMGATASRAKSGDLAMLQFRSILLQKTFLEAQRNLGFKVNDFIEYQKPETSEQKKEEILKKYKNSEEIKAAFDRIIKEERDFLDSKINAAVNAITDYDLISEDEIENLRKSGEFRAQAEKLINGYLDVYGAKENVVFVNSIYELDDDLREKMAANLESRGFSFEEVKGGIEGFSHGGKTYIIGDALSSPGDVLKKLKHERTHWGLNSVRRSEKAEKFFDGIMDVYGGEEIVRAAVNIASNTDDFYKDKYEVAEEFLCRIAEKVQSKNELNEKEKSIFEQAKSFMVDAFSYIPKNAPDEFIANQIRLIWDRNFGENLEDEDYFADLDNGFKWSIRKADAERFASELQDYIDGKLDNKHVFRLGTTPEVMRLVGADDLPIELAASVLHRKELKHALDLKDLKNLPSELADPIAIMQSSTIPDSITLITELPTIDKHNMLVAIHLNKQFGKVEINSIRSIYEKSEYGIQSAVNRGELLYLNTKRKPKWLTLPFQHASGRKAIIKAYGHEIFTEADLSQAEKDNIFELRQNNPRFRYSFRDTRSAVELEALDRKHRELYERYKNGDQEAYKEAVRLVAEEGRRKEYEVKVYHGTGSDGFNVADASSKYEENGEGNQAHGAGLYVAVSKETAERYRDNAVINAKKEILSHLRIKGLSLSDILDWKILVDGNQEVLRIMFSEMVENPYIFSFDEYIEIQNDWVKKSDNDYDRAVHNQAKKAIETIKQAFKDKGIRTDDVSVADIKGSFFNWLTNLNKENTLDADKPLKKQGEGVRKAIFEYYKSRPDDYIAPKDIEDLDAYKDGERFYKDLIFQMRREGAKNPQLEASKLLAKLGIKGITYNGRQDGRCFVSFEGGATVKLQDPFTFNDAGELIPLTERFDSANPDMRWSVRDSTPSDAEIAEAERQIEEVRAKYKNTPMWLKAPNGADTKLTERQWLLVRTPNFKKWFGDWENDPKNASKVVDENGEPLVVYHRTNNKFNMFQSGNSAGLIYFSETDKGAKAAARGKKRVQKVFLNIKNPVNAKGNPIPWYEAEDSKNTNKWKEDWYDSVYVTDEAGISIAVFNPNQIKSATDNVGTFRADNPDIRWSVKGLTQNDINKTFDETRRKIPYSGAKPPVIISDGEKRNYGEEINKVEKFLETYHRVKAADGFNVNIRSLERPPSINGKKQMPTLLERARHLISIEDNKGNVHNQLDYEKLSWVYKIPETVHTAQAVYLREWGSLKVRAYVKNYEGSLHIVLVNQKGEAYGHLITQFPKKQNERHAHLQDARLVWYTPNTLPIDSSQQAQFPKVKQGNISNFGNRKSFSFNPSESQGINSNDMDFSVNFERGKEKAMRRCTVMFAADLFKSDGEITKSIKEEAGRVFGAILTQKEIDGALKDSAKIAQRLSERFDKKAALLPSNIDIFSEARDFARSRAIERLRSEVEKAMNLQHRADRVKKSIKENENARIEREKKEKALEERRALESEKGFSLEELLAEGVDLETAIFDFESEDAIRTAIYDIAFLARKKFSENSPGYAALLRSTFMRLIKSAAKELPYGRSRESIMNFLNSFMDLKNPDAILKNAKEVAIKLAKYYKEHLEDIAIEEEEERLRALKSEEAKAKTKAQIAELKAKMRELKANYRRKRMLAKLEKLLGKFSASPEKKFKLDRKIDALSEYFLACGKKYFTYYLEEEEGVAGSRENVKDEQERLMTQNLSEQGDALYNKLQLNALSVWGGLAHEDDIARIASALLFTQNFIADEKAKMVADLYRWEEAARKDAEILSKGLNSRKKNLARKKGSVIAQTITNVSILKHVMENLFVSSARGEVAKSAQSVVDRISRAISVAYIEKRRMYNEESEWLNGKLEEVYGSIGKANNELLAEKSEFAKYSKYGVNLSKAHLISIIAMLEQENMQVARETIEQDANREAEEGEERLLLKDGKAKDLWRRFEMLEDMRGELSTRDLLFLEEIKGHFAEMFPVISQAVLKVTGRPLTSESKSYFPIFREGDISINSSKMSRARIPGYIMARTVSYKDIDENMDILSVFRTRAEEDSHFVAFNDLPFRMNAIFNSEELKNVVKTKMSDNERNEFLRFLGQSVLDDKTLENTSDAQGIAWFSTIAAFTGLAWNPVSALKQISGAWAFGLEVGIWQNLKDRYSAIFTEEGRRAFADVFKDVYMKNRRNAEINEGLEIAIRQFKEGVYGTGMSAFTRFIAKLKPFGMIGIADSVASSWGGAMIFARHYENYRQAHSDDQARKMAMQDLMDIVERTQQSSFTFNLSSLARNHGLLGKALTLFKSNPQLFFSYEIKAFKDWKNDIGNLEKQRHFAAVVLLNHFILPAIFNGIGTLLSLAMGDDWDDDDWKLLIGSSVLDVLSGWWLGSIIKGGASIVLGASNRDISSEVIPATSLQRVLNQAGLIIRDVYEGNLSKNFGKRSVGLFKQSFSPARYLIKVIENITDGKEGVLW